MGAPALAANRLHKQRALPTLLYAAQLTPVSQRPSRHVVSRMLRLLGSTLGRRWLVELARWGGPDLGSALAQTQAARRRGAVSTFRQWPEVAGRMQQTVGVDGRRGGTRALRAVHLAQASRALQGEAPAHVALLPCFEEVFGAGHVQAEVTRI